MDKQIRAWREWWSPLGSIVFDQNEFDKTGRIVLEEDVEGF